MALSVDTVVAAMDTRWRGFGNVSSQKLRELWAEIVRVFNAQIETPSERWPVIPAELGAGKTTLAKTWCAMLPRDSHPGALVVVRTIEQAEEFARDVNAWAGAPDDARVAFAYHSHLDATQQRDLRLREWRPLTEHPVLVICHRAYELGLDKHNVGDDNTKFEQLATFKTDRRGLVIIDEALDQVLEARIDRHELEHALQFLARNRSVEHAHTRAIDVLCAVQRTLRDADYSRHRVLPLEALLHGTAFTRPEDASAALAALWNAARIAKNLNPAAKPKDVSKGESVRRSKALLRDVTMNARRNLMAYRWVAGETERAAVSGHRLLLMPAGTHGVILDATGHLNNVYLNRPDQFDILPLPRVRDYGTVAVYVANTKDTGKTHRNRQVGAERAERILRDVLAHYGERATERRALVVCAMNSENFYTASPLAQEFAELKVGHWNALDGRNDWQDFDTVVIATLNYGLLSTDLNTYMAVRGEELDDEALNACADADEVRAIRETRIAAEVAQAIGRIRLRRMTTEDGRCEPCDVFLRLPNGGMVADPDRLVDHVKRALPGAAFVSWAEASTKLRRDGRPPVARDAITAALLAYVEEMPTDSVVDVDDVRRAIGATAHGTWFRVQREAATRLAELGAKIEPARGRQPAVLVRGAAADVVLRALSAGALTSAEIAERTMLPPGAVSRRLRAYKAAGVVAVGEVVTAGNARAPRYCLASV